MGIKDIELYYPSQDTKLNIVIGGDNNTSYIQTLEKIKESDDRIQDFLNSYLTFNYDAWEIKNKYEKNTEINNFFKTIISDKNATSETLSKLYDYFLSVNSPHNYSSNAIILRYYIENHPNCPDYIIKDILFEQVNEFIFADLMNNKEIKNPVGQYIFNKAKDKGIIPEKYFVANASNTNNKTLRKILFNHPDVYDTYEVVLALSNPNLSEDILEEIYKGLTNTDYYEEEPFLIYDLKSEQFSSCIFKGENKTGYIISLFYDYVVKNLESYGPLIVVEMFINIAENENTPFSVLKDIMENILVNFQDLFRINEIENINQKIFNHPNYTIENYLEDFVKIKEDNKNV